MKCSRSGITYGTNPHENCTYQLPSRRQTLVAPSQCKLRVLALAAQQRHDTSTQPAPRDATASLYTAATAVAVICSFAANVQAARAQGTWKPRRHHRHIGERFTDTWADAIVEVWM